ncbi:hypothetical protein KUCAC02_024012 [Chaenocephalus aceratus]|uniref:Uncharacterized protein n=1 Tax=Chaenocephalus aceratus TaxID=36190 RepID=A0ACB9WHJ0_CHAAC|nr:hypothetical protein KUCAC02_024012 [Chaenocephalus aceratus]
MLVAEAFNMEPAVNTTAAAPASSDSGEEDFFSYGPGANRGTSPPEEHCNVFNRICLIVELLPIDPYSSPCLIT